MYNTRRLIWIRYLCFFLLTVLVFALLGGVYHQLVRTKTRTMVLHLSYPGAERGLNPGGSRFTMVQLTSDAVLDGAKAGLAVAGEANSALRARITLTSSQGGAEGGWDPLAQGVESPYLPTTFRLTYSQRDKLAENESGTFLQALAQQYTRCFTPSGGDPGGALVFDPASVSGLDYLELCEVLRSQAERLLDRLTSSGGTAEAEALRDQLDRFCAVELEGFQSYIVQNSIARDRSALVGRLGSWLGRARGQHQRYAQDSAIALEALERYDAVRYLGRAGADSLVLRSSQDGAEASRLAQQIDRYDRSYQRLREAEDTSPDLLQYADQYAQKVMDHLSQLSQQVAAWEEEPRTYVACQLEDPPEMADTVLRSGACGAGAALLALCYVEAHRKNGQKAGEAT